ncbi:proline racemase family protein [Mesorhizobium sp.]|uniref:proline racemase family protein n=1 Tax=Mesorhizobium sp. TaxID=1871066 RepID=UPI00257EC79C|nr:proline racemase family protein [Mesorhizobium sp.]
MLSTVGTYHVVDSHTLGQTTRVIFSGGPKLAGTSVREKREDFKARFEHLKGIWLTEPRGTVSAFGLLLVPSQVADFGAIFMGTTTYEDMCGHGTIGLAATLVALGTLQAGRDDGFTLEVPAGVVSVKVLWNEDGSFSGAKLYNIPSYVYGDPLLVDTTFGQVTVDLVHSGMIYALIDAGKLSLTLEPDNLPTIINTGVTLKDEIFAAFSTREDLTSQGLHGVLFYEEEPDHDGSCSSKHVLVVGPQRYDRSPCGTGTAARLTHLVQQGRIKEGGAYRAFNLHGSNFTARPAKMADGKITAEVEGTAHIMAFSNLVVEKTDPFVSGFRSRFWK